MGRHQLKWILATINFIQRLNTIVNICWGKKGLHCTLLYCLPVPFLGFTFFVQQMVLHTVLGIFSLSESQESITTQKSFFHIFGILMEPKKVIVQPSLEASFFKEPYAFSMSDLCWIGHSNYYYYYHVCKSWAFPFFHVSFQGHWRFSASRLKRQKQQQLRPLSSTPKWPWDFLRLQLITGGEGRDMDLVS